MRPSSKSDEAVNKKRILSICTHNSARSQMAEGFINNLYGDHCEAYTAGTHPSKVHPYALKVMKESGVDISAHRAKSVGQLVGKEFEWVVTVCDRAKQTCRFFPPAKDHLHKSSEDPAQAKGTDDEILEVFRGVRDEIREWIEETFVGSKSG